LERSTWPFSLGERGGRTKSLTPRFWQAVVELGHELGAAVDLDGLDGEGHALKDRIQEAGRRVSGGAAVCLQYLPAAENVAGGEVFEVKAGEELKHERYRLERCDRGPSPDSL